MCSQVWEPLNQDIEVSSTMSAPVTKCRGGVTPGRVSGYAQTVSVFVSACVCHCVCERPGGQRIVGRGAVEVKKDPPQDMSSFNLNRAQRG